MGLVSYSIPNLANGVSQQPAALRLPTSCEESINGWPSVLSGLQKRPPTEWVAKLNTTVTDSAAGHLIRRSDGYQYIVMVNQSELLVYDLLGNKQTVKTPYGTSYLSRAFNPVDSIRFMTFGDYTFIANKEVVVKANSYGEAGPTGTFSTTGSVGTYETLPTSPTLGDVYLVADEGVYYKREILPAIPQIIGWSADYLSFVTTVPSDYTLVTALPANPTLGQKVAMQVDNAYSLIYSTAIQYRLYTAVEYQAAVAAAPGWKGYSLSQLGGVSSGRLDPATHGTVMVTQSIANSNYSIYIDGVLKANILTHNGTDAANSVESTSAIAASLGYALTGNSIPNVVIGSTIIMTGLGATTKIFTMAPSGDKAMKCYRYTVDSFSNLPPNEKEGRVIRIAGDPSVQGDDYFVQYKSGVWEECVGWSQAAGFVNSTMPHVLIRNSDGTWTFQPHTWNDRIVGSSASNGFPAFVDSTINDIFVYSNRLGMLSDENVILSEADTFENFFRATVAQFLDSDRIDVAVFNKDVNILRHAVPFSKDLLLSADNNQFRLSYQGILSAKNIQIEYTTSFNVSARCKPVNMGNSVYFVDDRPNYNYGKVLEYYAKENQTGDDVDDLTEAIPEYIPGQLRFMAASPRMKFLVTNSFGAPANLYVYKYYWAGGQKVQNAWGTWTLPDCIKIHWTGFLDNFLYIIVQRADGIHLEKIQIDENVFRNASDFTAHIDRKVVKSKLTLAYNSTTNVTTVTLPYGTTSTPECITFIGDVKAFRNVVTKLSTTQFTVSGDITAATQVYAGIPYTFEYTFSQQYMRVPNRTGQALVLEGRLQLRYMSVEYHNTAFFKFTVSQPGRDDVVTLFDGRLVGSKNAILGQASFASGTHRIPLMSNAADVSLKIANDSPYANAFGAAEWQAVFQAKSQRIN